MADTHWVSGQYDRTATDGPKRPGLYRVEEAPGARWIADVRTEEHARLIAAAPDMLYVLQQILPYMEHPDVQAMNFAIGARVPAENVRKVIAKALGKEV